MKIVVTGGAGAIGGNLVLELLEQGHDVVSIDNRSSSPRTICPEDRNIREDVAGVLCAQFIESFRPDWVFHLAALFANQNSVDHPFDDLITNGFGTLNVLRACEQAGVAKVLYTSSSCVAGEGDLLLPDAPPASWDTPYAITKGLGEQYARYFARRGLDTVIVRPFNVYGPGEWPGPYRNVIPNWFALAAQGEPLPITGTGLETRTFTYVRDVVRGMIAAMDHDTRAGDCFNLASENEVRISQLASAVNEIAGSTAGVVHVPRRDWDVVARRRADISKSKRVLGWHPAVSLTEGLRLTWEWFKANAM